MSVRQSPPACVLNLSPKVLSKSAAWVHLEDWSEVINTGRMSPLLGLLHGWKPLHASQELGGYRGHSDALFTISMSMRPSKLSLSPKIQPSFFLHQEPGEIAPEVSTLWCTQANTHKYACPNTQTHNLIHTQRCAHKSWTQPTRHRRTPTGNNTFTATAPAPAAHRAMSNTPGSIPFSTSACSVLKVTSALCVPCSTYPWAQMNPRLLECGPGLWDHPNALPRLWAVPH